MRLPLQRRSYVAAAAMTVALAVLAACSTGAEPGESTNQPTSATGEEPGSGGRVINQYFSSNNAFFNSWQQGSDEAAEALGMENERQVDDANPDKTLTIFRSAQTRGFDAITSMLADPGMSQILLSTAQENGTYVANAWNIAPWLTPWDIGDTWVSFIAPNDVAASEALATMLFEEMGGEGEVIHITGVPGNTADILRTEGFDRALANFPDIELVAREPGQFNRGDTEPVISALLTANPEAKAVFSQNDDTAMGVLAVLAARDIDDVLVTGIDGIPDMLEAIADGRAFATWAQHGGLAAAWQTVQVYDAMAGVELHPLERMMWLGTFIINTPEAAAAYNEMMFGGGDFPFDYRRMSRALHPDDWAPPVLFAPIDLEAYYSLLADKPADYELPAEYLEAVESTGFDAIAKEYADRLATDPFAEIRELCKGNGCQDITSF